MRRNLKSTAYHILKQRLITCEYEPGSMLKESELAAELEISRTPIREAISLLETEGYLIVAPKKGIFVTDISLKDVVQIFQVRMEIEPLTLRMAIPNLPVEKLIELRKKFENPPDEKTESYKLDSEMHLFLIEHCENKYIIDMMNTVFDKNARIVISSKQNTAHTQEAQQEHIDLLNSLIDQDYDKAVEQMKVHISHCRKSAIDYFYSV